FFMALARPAGLLMAVALAMALWTGKGRMGGSAAKKAAVPLLALAAGVVVYFLFMKFSTGRFMEGFAAQPLFGADHGVSQLIHPWDWFVSNFIRNSYSWSDYGTGVLDRIFFLLYALALVLSWKDFDKRWWVFALVLGLVPALSGRLVSFIRYGLVLFPLFVFASRRFKEKPAYLAVPSLLLQVILALAHSLNFWVA
ncbi:MAG TPA: hypothetical protein VJ873_13145, partial [bacterium]|nr:hypothetical protein [bacterium]